MIINNLPSNTQAEKDKKSDLAKRAAAVGLDGNSTEKEVVAAEAEK